jgi:hypothetical protein
VEVERNCYRNSAIVAKAWSRKRDDDARYKLGTGLTEEQTHPFDSKGNLHRHLWQQTANLRGTFFLLQ